MSRWGKVARAVLAFAACGVLVPAVAQGQGKPARITGGVPAVSPEEAPWSVLILADGVKGVTRCSGSLIAPDRVLTAAHCTYDGDELRPPESYLLTAGIVDRSATADRSRVQTRLVRSYRVHPRYDRALEGYDVAVLTVDPPFDVSGAAVRPIELAPAGSAVPTARVWGWGQTTPGSTDGKLYSLTQSIVRSFHCADGWPAITCGQSPSGSTCPGDSGSGLVAPTSPPRLLGVDSYGLGAGGECAAGRYTGWIDVTAPANSAFINGSDTPPLAPRASGETTLVPGDPLTCQAPPFSGAPGVSYDFVAAETGQTLQSGPATYRPAGPAVGHPVYCVAVARNAGGTSEDASSTVTMLDPGLSIAVASDGVVTAAASQPNVPLARVLVLDRAGAAIRALGYDPVQRPKVPRLATGRYSVCIQSDPTPQFIQSAACQPWVVRGAAATLVKKGSVRYRRGRWRIGLMTTALEGRRVTLRWQTASCNRCKVKTARTTRRVLRSTLTLVSPRMSRRRVVKLRIDAPSATVGDVPYAASHRTLSVHRR
jgi:hypothetical protein